MIDFNLLAELRALGYKGSGLPTADEVRQWFREQGIYLEIILTADANFAYCVAKIVDGHGEVDKFEVIGEYDEAMVSGVKYVVDVLGHK